jgi:hypothetical protein
LLRAEKAVAGLERQERAIRDEMLVPRGMAPQFFGRLSPDRLGGALPPGSVFDNSFVRREPPD